MDAMESSEFFPDGRDHIARQVTSNQQGQLLFGQRHHWRVMVMEGRWMRRQDGAATAVGNG